MLCTLYIMRWMGAVYGSGPYSPILLPHVFWALIGNFGLGLVNMNNGLLIKS